MSEMKTLRDRMAKAWGGDSTWLTTGNKVADLVVEWMPDIAAAERERLLARIETLAEALESVQVPCTGPGCPGCTAGRIRALVAEARAR